METRVRVTERQQKVLDAINSYRRQHGFCPSLRDIMDALGIRNANGVQAHLRALRKKGLVAWEPGRARTLRCIG